MILYQFPFSHYCENTRWHLDARGFAHEVRDVPPGGHRMIAQRHDLPGTVPILLDGDVALGDSAAIAEHLESKPGGPSLLPDDPEMRAAVLEGRTDRYLFGDRLTLADITAASLLGPATAPEGSPWHGLEVPAEITAQQQRFADTPAGAWIAERYRKDRAPIR